MDHTEILDAGTQQGLEVLKEFSGGEWRENFQMPLRS